MNGLTRDEFRADAAELVLAALVGNDSLLVIGTSDAGSRRGVLDRAVRSASHAADALWNGLGGVPYGTVPGDRRATLAIRCAAQLVARHSEILSRSAEDRAAVLSQMVSAAILAADMMIEHLGGS